MKQLIYILSFLLLSSCSVLKPKYITQVQHDTTVVYKNNTVFQHDSVIVFKDRNVFIKGDTVYTTITEFKDRWRVKEVHDTLYKEKVKYEYKKIPVEIEKKLSGMQKAMITLGKIFLGLVLILLGYFGLKKLVFKV